MADEWDFYFSSLNGVLASFCVNLALREIAPDAQRPWLLWASVNFNDLRGDGLSGSEEAPILNEMEDSLVQGVGSLADFVGRITLEGRREFYFYGAQPEGFEQAVAKAVQVYPEHHFETGSRLDAEWSQYLDVLCPSPEDAKLIEQLREMEAEEQAPTGDNAMPKTERHD